MYRLQTYPLRAHGMDNDYSRKVLCPVDKFHKELQWVRFAKAQKRRSPLLIAKNSSHSSVIPEFYVEVVDHLLSPLFRSIGPWTIPLIASPRVS